MHALLPELAITPGRAFNPTVADWFELRGSLVAAAAVTQAALAREESRGAHQREDFPDSNPALAQSLRVSMTRDGMLAAEFER